MCFRLSLSTMEWTAIYLRGTFGENRFLFVRSFRAPAAPHKEQFRTGFGNQFIFGYEVEVELPIQLENGNEVEYE